MAKEIKIIKLRLEIITSRKYQEEVQAVYEWLKFKVVRDILFVEKVSGLHYPLSTDKIVSMLSVTDLNDRYVIGIRPQSLSRPQYLDYLKLLDIEYGNKGVEIRAIRKALEEVGQRFRKIVGGSYGS